MAKQQQQVRKGQTITKGGKIVSKGGGGGSRGTQGINTNPWRTGWADKKPRN